MTDAATTVSLTRLYLLRAMYLLIVVGLGVVVWPRVLHAGRPWELMEGVSACMLAAFSALCALGLRYPLQMLPLLLWEILWKTLWLLDVALPAWQAGTLDAATERVAADCLGVVIIPLVIPWRYLFDHYLAKRGDRWR